jgi:hypothetical protein
MKQHEYTHFFISLLPTQAFLFEIFLVFCLFYIFETFSRSLASPCDGNVHKPQKTGSSSSSNFYIISIFRLNAINKLRAAEQRHMHEWEKYNIIFYLYIFIAMYGRPCVCALHPKNQNETFISFFFATVSQEPLQTQNAFHMKKVAGFAGPGREMKNITIFMWHHHPPKPTPC